MDGYRDHLVSMDLSDKTVAIYNLRLNQAEEWCRNRKLHLFDITATEARTLAKSFPASNSCRSQLRSALKHYWEWVGRPNPPVGAIRVPKKPRGVCKAVTPDQARDLVKHSLGWRPPGLAVLVGLYLGLRVHEIASMEWDRFSRDLDEYTVFGKNEVTATLPVHPVLQLEVRTSRRLGPWVFPGSHQREGSHVADATVNVWVKQVGAEVGLPRLIPHELRHTAIATVNDSTGDLRAAQTFARHARPDDTARYTRTTKQRLVEAVLSLDYLA